MDLEILSNSTWVADCLDCPLECPFRRPYGQEADAYKHARAHIKMWADHRVLVYVASLLFKPEKS
jgi:hypothetical protein